MLSRTIGDYHFLADSKTYPLAIAAIMDVAFVIGKVLVMGH